MNVSAVITLVMPMLLAPTSPVVINVLVMMDTPVTVTVVPMSTSVTPMSVHQMPLVPIL